MEFELGHILSITAMDFIGICVNAWYLYTVKTRMLQLNAIDILQACKTGLNLIGLIACIWTEFWPCTSKVCTGAKEIADIMFYYSVCFAFLAIAFVRYKACEYRGQASVLLTQRYAIKTLMICFTPAGMFSTAVLSLMINSKQPGPANVTSELDIELLTGDSKVAYEISHIIVFVLSPIFVSALMYFRICNVVTQTARTMESSMSNRKHDPAKLITYSVTVLLSTMFIIWGIYTIVRIIHIFIKLNELYFIYWKLVVFIVQPSVEGLLHKTGKKSNPSRIHTLSHVRSTRQIYPIGAAVLSASIADESENNIIGRKLPVLMEEYETQAKTQDETKHNKIKSGKIDCKKETVRVRRQSFIHPRASVVIKNAALIGLEYQSKANILDTFNKRKTSTGKLNSGLLNIEKETLHRTRRLSNCLRFSAADAEDDHSFDEIYHSYKTLYSIRSTKSAKSSVSENSHIEKFNKQHGRKNSSSSEGNESPSQKRWRKLYTTARTARKFSTYRKGKSPSIVEEEHLEELNNESPVEKDKDIVRKSCLAHVDQKTHLPSVYLDHQRLSLDSNLLESPVPKQKGVAEKKRSISCISNVWMKHNQEHPSRKKSVSFTSNIEVDGTSMSERDSNITRSISYDSKIRISYRKESEEKSAKAIRHSHDHNLANNNNKNERRDIEKWLNDRNTTREECIAKLMEMKEYF